MRITIYSWQSKSSDWLAQSIAEYKTKIARFCNFDIQLIRYKYTLKRGREDAHKEEQKLFKKLSSDDYVILLDEVGKSYDSIQFSQKLEKLALSGKKRIVIIVGGPYGVGDQIKKISNEKLSLSKLTFNHHIALQVLLEQIYRGFTIMNNIKYHNE